MATQVGMVQISNVFTGHTYLPLAPGLLQTAAMSGLRDPEWFSFLPPLIDRAPIAEAALRFRQAEILLFSVYLWNLQYSLALARAVKTARPETVIVFGGPQIPNDSGEFLQKHSCVDIACHGEGESIIAPLLEHALTGDLRDIPSIGFLDREGRYVRTSGLEPVQERLPDSIPSPYLSGLFEELVKLETPLGWRMLLETNRGCPYSCTFCSWNGARDLRRIREFSLERVFSELEWAGSHQIEAVFCCDANFGILPRDKQIIRYAGEVKRRTGFPKVLSIQTTKHDPGRIYHINRCLLEEGLNEEVALPLQTVDRAALRLSRRRNITIPVFAELQQRFAVENRPTYSDMILGLPGESYISFADGISAIIAAGQHHRMQFNSLILLPNAELASVEARQRYGLETVLSPMTAPFPSWEGAFVATEWQEIVIATSSMSRSDWRRARIFAWYATLLHFHKLLQVPFVLLEQLVNLSYRQMIEAFIETEHGKGTVFSRIHGLFEKMAAQIQSGGPDTLVPEGLNGTRMAVEDYALVSLQLENTLESFYAEAEGVLRGLLRREDRPVPDGLLEQAGGQNRALPDGVLEQAGGQNRALPDGVLEQAGGLNRALPDCVLEQAVGLNRALVEGGKAGSSQYACDFNLWEIYQGRLCGEKVHPTKGRRLYSIDHALRFRERVVNSA